MENLPYLHFYIKLQFSVTKQDDFFSFYINANTLMQGLL